MDADAFVRELAADRTHGASELARRTLDFTAHWAESCPAASTTYLLLEFDRLAKRLIATRPSMAPIASLVTSWQESTVVLCDQPLPAARAAAAQSARDGIKKSLTAVQDTARHAAALIPPRATLLTHSLSSTIVEVFRQLRDRSVKVIATESRPDLEGHRLATQLSAWKIPVTLITDAEMGLFAARTDFAVVGADSVLSDGAVINKAGTSLLALAAREHAVPFYVCAESFKRRSAAIDEVVLEEMDPAELHAPGDPGIRARNIYFDVTPARLITGWIAESGLMTDFAHNPL